MTPPNYWKGKDEAWTLLPHVFTGPDAAPDAKAWATSYADGCLDYTHKLYVVQEVGEAIEARLPDGPSGKHLRDWTERELQQWAMPRARRYAAYTVNSPGNRHIVKLAWVDRTLPLGIRGGPSHFVVTVNLQTGEVTR